MRTTRHNNLTLLELDAAGPLLASDRDVADLVGEAIGADADIVVVPLERLDPRFLELRSGIAGVFFQKFQNYQRRLAIIGDISVETSASKSLHDFVHETNAVGHHFFAATREALLAVI